MSLIKTTSIPRNREKSPLIQTFLKQEHSEDFPFRLALHSLEQLENSYTDEEELNLCLLEDIVASSIYATFYEAIFTAIKNNPQFASELVEQFEKSTDEREQIIAQQTEHHINYIANGGHCPGCPSCENHTDVDELIPHWKSANKDFFLTLYLGMQTIRYAMEHVLYDLIPFDKNLPHHLRQQDIRHFRQFLYNYVEKCV